MTAESATLQVSDAARTSVSPRRAEEIVETWLDPENGLQLVQPVDMAALRATASAYAQLESMTAYLEAIDPRTPSGQMRGPLNHNGVPRPVMRIYFTAYRETMSGLRALGATPAARAEMVGAMSASPGLASALASHRKNRERQ